MSLETDSDEKRPGDQMRWFAAILAVITVGLVAWYFLAVRQDYSVLYSGLRTEDAASIVAALEKQGTPYRLGAGGSEIRVPAAKLDETRLDLAATGATHGGVEGFELFNDSDMGLTDFAQKIRYQRALQGEIARTIMTMEGVADARVHISMPERTLFRSERRSAEAAVTLVMRSGAEETPQRIEGVQRLVAAAVPDLQVTDVVVLNGRGEIISPRVDISPLLMSGRSGAHSSENAPSIEAVMEVMRASLPNHRFEVSIEPSEQSLAGGADDQGPPTRIVTVTTESRLSDVEMENASAALRAAGIVDGDSGGTLAFRIGPPAMFEALRPAEASANAEPVEETGANSSLASLAPYMGAAILALLAVIIAGFLVWSNRARLGRDDHDAFAEQLREALKTKQAEAPNV